MWACVLPSEPGRRWNSVRGVPVAWIMRAIVLNEFGHADVLSVAEAPEPLVGPDTVLVRARAASVNPVDFKIREGYLADALPHHFPLIPGWDVSGVVERVGPAVTEYAPGDEVIGYVRTDHVQHGTYAELVAAPVRTLAAKPASLDFAEAASLPLAGLTALQTLRAVHVGPGDVVVVHAAAGGVGHLAVQVARALGASRVIGTASEPNHDFVRSLGAEAVSYGDGLERRVAELVGGDGRVDAAVDFVGGDALATSTRMVRHPARQASVVEMAVADRGGSYVFVRPDATDLAWLAATVNVGKLRPVVTRRFPLPEAADAHRASESGHVHGKIAITVA